jgi:hypothetical protein
VGRLGVGSAGAGGGVGGGGGVGSGGGESCTRCKHSLQRETEVKANLLWDRVGAGERRRSLEEHFQLPTLVLEGRHPQLVRL